MDSRKVSHRHCALLGKTLPVELYTLDFMKSISRKVAFSAIWTGHDRHILYDQNILTLSVCSGNSADLGAFFGANVTYHTLDALHENIMRL